MIKIRSYFFSPESWYNLAWIRVFFYLLVILNLAGFTSFKFYLNFPDELLFPTGIIQNALIKNVLKDYIEMIYIAFYVSLVFSLVGFLTKVSTWTAFITGFIIFSIPRAFGAVLFLFVPLLFVLFVMALSHCGDHLSIDSLIFKKKKKPVESMEYNWPVKACKLIFIFFFFSSGFHKLKTGGLDWFLTDNLVNNFVCSPYTRIDVVPLFVSSLKLNYFATSYKIFFKVAAFTVVIAEILSPLMLISKFKKSFLTIFILMQVLSLFTLFINPIITIPIYVVWINWKLIHNSLKKSVIFFNDNQ